MGNKASDFEDFFGKLDENVSIETIKNSLIISCDNPVIDRLDFDYKDSINKCIKIDHHILVENYGDVEWVDTSYSSCCEMIATLAIENNWVINETAATYLYLGLTTDAGRFLYSYTPNLFKVAQKLVECKANVSKIYPFIYEQTIDSTRFHGFCQSNFQLTGYGVGYNKLTPELLATLGIDAYQGAGMVNALSNMKGVEIWAHFSETEEHTVRAELRSKGLPVNEIANEFGGGGHKQAAGCTLLNWDEVDKCIEKLDNLIFNTLPHHQIVQDVLPLIEEASKISKTIYDNALLDIEIKEDNSPVTQVDKAIDLLLRTKLNEMYPEYGILSEETSDNKDRLNKERVWIIDPIDGTKDFIAHDDQWAINVALVENHEVIVSFIAVPSKNIIYYAMKDGGAYKKEDGVVSKIHTSLRPDKLIGLTSHFHISELENKYYEQYKNLIVEVRQIGSAYKFGLIAEGKAHINLKLAQGTKEWDIAPGVLIVKEAGGSFTKPSGEEYKFNKDDVYNHEGYIVMGKFNKGLLK